jgi:hypothetical protein
MIKDFETVKQLKELSDVINGFKSEAVQLRIIELLFKGITVGSDVEENETEVNPTSESPIKTNSRKRKVKKVNSGETGLMKPTGRQYSNKMVY